MNRNTIYCTKEQTKKALELGAPIELYDEEEKESYCFWRLRFIDLQNGFLAKYSTAEQLIGWLEDQNILVERTRFMGKYAFRLLKIHSSGEQNLHIQGQDYPTYKEATLAAIDAALDYLIKSKEK